MAKPAQGKNRRIDRVGDLVRAELSEILVRGLKDPRVKAGFVTVTDVDVSSDLRHALVWVSLFGDDKAQVEALDGLEAAAGFLRRELGQRMTTKHTPALRFKRDKSAEQGAWVETTLAGLQYTDQEDE